MRSRRQFSGSAVLTIAAALVAALPVVAQQALDRTQVSRLPGRRRCCACPRGPAPALANGAELVVSEKHDLPLVSFSITFLGGADQFEKADRRGVACADGGDAERGHQDSRRRGAVECAAAARRRRSRPASEASPAPCLSSRPRESSRRRSTSSPTCCSIPRFPRTRSSGSGAAAGRADPGAGPARLDRRRACSRECSTARHTPSASP